MEKKICRSVIQQTEHTFFKMFNYYVLLHGFDFVTSQISGLKPKKQNKYIVLILGHTNNKKIVNSLSGMQKTLCRCLLVKNLLQCVADTLCPWQKTSQKWNFSDLCPLHIKSENSSYSVCLPSINIRTNLFIMTYW